MDLAQSYAEQHRKYLQSEHPNLLSRYEKSGDLDEYLQGGGGGRGEPGGTPSKPEPQGDEGSAVSGPDAGVSKPPGGGEGIDQARPDLSARPTVRGLAEAKAKDRQRSHVKLAKP